jgi:hypothetical protein
MGKVPYIQVAFFCPLKINRMVSLFSTISFLFYLLLSCTFFSSLFPCAFSFLHFVSSFYAISWLLRPFWLFFVCLSLDHLGLFSIALSFLDENELLDMCLLVSSVADPDPGPGSGAFLTSGSGMVKK